MSGPVPPPAKAPPPPGAPPARRGPPPPPGGSPEAAAPVSGDRFAVSSGRQIGAQKVTIYGPAGVGKSNLARLAPSPVFLDIEDSTKGLDVRRLGSDKIATWADLRSCLQSNAMDEFKTIVIDSVTKAEELAIADTLIRVKKADGSRADNLEAYGFGKGAKHLYDTFLLILMDLERHVRAGRNVVLISHVCTSKVPNPMAEDWIRYEPRLAQTKGGDFSIRSRVIEWSDHVLFIGYDVATTDEGKGKGGGTRTIFTREMPTHIAKVRDHGDGSEAIEPRSYENRDDGSVWPLILGGGS